MQKLESKRVASQRIILRTLHMIFEFMMWSPLLDFENINRTFQDVVRARNSLQTKMAALLTAMSAAQTSEWLSVVRIILFFWNICSYVKKQWNRGTTASSDTITCLFLTAITSTNQCIETRCAGPIAKLAVGGNIVTKVCLTGLRYGCSKPKPKPLWPVTPSWDFPECLLCW